FTALEYVSPGTEKAPGPLWVGYLTEDDVKNACREYGKAQEWTNVAAGRVRRSDYETASAYGTAVHLELKREIERQRLAPSRKDSLVKKPGTSMLSEISLLKTLDETGELPAYGEKGSVRLDLLDPDRDLIFKKNEETGREKIANASEVRTVCNYDI